MKTLVILITTFLFFSCSSSKKISLIPESDNWINQLKESSIDLDKVIGIDSVCIDLLKEHIEFINKRDSLNKFKEYEISFITDNFNSLGKSIKENIFNFLLKNNFSIHFLGNKLSTLPFSQNCSVILFQMEKIVEWPSPHLRIDVLCGGRCGRGYFCELEAIEDKYKIIDVIWDRQY